LENTQKLLPITVGNLTINNSIQVKMALNMERENHNIYDNVAAQIFTSKLNTKNDGISCKAVDDAIKYGDNILHSVNYHGIGTVKTRAVQLSNAKLD
jgi:hypothetical protein